MSITTSTISVQTVSKSNPIGPEKTNSQYCTLSSQVHNLVFKQTLNYHCSVS